MNAISVPAPLFIAVPNDGVQREAAAAAAAAAAVATEQVDDDTVTVFCKVQSMNLSLAPEGKCI
jgi:hypothetical protein